MEVPIPSPQTYDKIFRPLMLNLLACKIAPLIIDVGEWVYEWDGMQICAKQQHVRFCMVAYDNLLRAWGIKPTRAQGQLIETNDIKKLHACIKSYLYTHPDKLNTVWRDVPRDIIYMIVDMISYE